MDNSNLTTEVEIWKTIPQYSDYDASSFGRIRRATIGRGTWPGRVLRPSAIPAGYLFVRVKAPQQEEFVQVYVHRLVAFAFIGPPPSPAHQVNHIDMNKSNNHADNLEYLTGKENRAHAHKLGAYRNTQGSRHHLARFTEPDIQSIRRRFDAQEATIQELATEYDVVWETIYYIVTRHTWKHVP
jgi:hypothetical protein